MAPSFIDGIAQVADDYDAFVLDLWGCVHDGLRPYPGAVDCLKRLGALGKGRLLLSNAPRPSGAIVARLAEIGVAADCFDAIVTSGDATIAALNRRDDPWHAALGRRYYHLGPARGSAMIEALHDQAVGFEAADYILSTGLVDDETETVADYDGLLRRALARRLPMLCANPDLVVMRGARTIPCAGALAQAYEAMGGAVRRHGKPGTGVFDMAFERLGGPEKARSLMVGDGLATDIAGAMAYGIDSAWIAGGIHGSELGYVPGAPLDRARIAAGLAARGARPTLVLAGLAW